MAGPPPAGTHSLPLDLLIDVDVLLVKALQLFVRLLLGIAVPLPDATRKQVKFPFSHLQIVIGELPPLFLHFAAELLPFATCDVPVHEVPLSCVEKITARFGTV